jgi:hypothetical protein
MRALRYIGLFVFVLLLELFLSSSFTFRAVNLAKYPYRREERYAALKAYQSDRTAEKQAAYQQEMSLAGRHSFRRQILAAGLVFSVFLVLDGIIICSWIWGRKAQNGGQIPIKPEL